MFIAWFVIATALATSGAAMLISPSPANLPPNSWFTMAILVYILAFLVGCIGLVSFLEQRYKATKP